VCSQGSLLNINEAVKQVELFVNIGQRGVADLINFLVDLSLSLLKYFDFTVDTSAFFLTVIREDFDTVLPSEATKTW
jgi:hypothetical protein